MQDINTEYVIDWLWRHGHFRNPQYSEAWSVNERDLPALTLTDLGVREAVKSIQELDANLDHLSQFHHGRKANPDGDIGPSTMALLSLPRCGQPDYAEDTATGSGGWPVGCDPERDDVHSVRVNLNTTRAPSKVKGYLDECMRNVEKISADIGVALRHILNGDPNDAEMDIRWDYLRGSVIGWNQFPNPGTCRQTIDGRLDIGYTPDVQMMSILMIHEYAGHGFRLQHTRGGIMNPSILRVPITWRGDSSYNALRRMYGGEPIDTPEPPVPVPPDDEETAVRGTLTVEVDGESRGRFIVVPRPEV